MFGAIAFLAPVDRFLIDEFPIYFDGNYIVSIYFIYTAPVDKLAFGAAYVIPSSVPTVQS